jgi:UDP:flavonoid glycosyltransferase YjiC (YdhE family)
MAAIFFGWELGANLGHVGKFLPLARALRDRGHDVAWAVASAAVGPLLEKEGFAWHLAPAGAERPRPGPPLSFADILLRFGYADAAGLRDRVEGWRALMQESGARLVLADFAPTALLAARGLGLPAMLYSSGFCVPPPIAPTPGLRPWLAVPAARLQAIEDAVLAGINTVLAHHGRPGLAALWRLFAVAEDALLGFPELDHYAQRGAARYWGALPDASLGAPPAWPDLPGTRLFAYLRRDCAHHEAALAALHELGLPTVAFIPDLTAEQEARFAAPHLVFSRAPVDLGAAAATAGAAVTYAGFSTTTRFLLAGKPLLLLPGHLEQYLLARRIAALGAGRCIPADGPPAGLAAALRHVVTDPGHAAAAQAFARKYAAFPQETVLANLVRRIEEIVAPPPAGDGPKEKP